MSARKPYTGAFRKLILAFDVGTTYSGVSYAILDPGKVPVIQGVTRYPAQQKVGGDSKIPTIIYYDARGNVKAVGAEALDEAFLEKAEDEGYTKVEWFKLHLRPKALAASHITDADIPRSLWARLRLTSSPTFCATCLPLPKTYIIETTPSGASFWSSIEHHIDFILTHPNGWEGQQQGLMRRAAVVAGLIEDGIGQDRLQFVTEGEASLHFCINKNNWKGITIIVDAVPVELSTSAPYANKANKDNAFEESRHLQVPLMAYTVKLRNSKFGAAARCQSYGERLRHKSTKLSFRTSSEPAYIRFGSARDKDLAVDIRNGQLKLDGETVSGFFEPSIQAIIDAIKTQKGDSSIDVLVIHTPYCPSCGRLCRERLLFGQLRDSFGSVSHDVCRPDGHVNKAVADGAISFYLDHFVSARVANLTYGVGIGITFDCDDPEHLQRSHQTYYDAAGVRCVRGAFSCILEKGTRVNEETDTHVSTLRSISVDIISYRGPLPYAKWLDLAPYSFSTLCTVTADTSGVPKRQIPPLTAHGSYHYHLDFEVGVERRSPATIVYDSVLQSRQ
ncbi:hypothetical protein BDZ89DRAFT_1091791 [Hymenopellis radicata]|nr:hypothetical protein BDZ89DRAFT_1091791 [Hymenopellis radicata]